MKEKTYAHIHSVLRATLIDRQRDPQDVIDETVLVNFGVFSVALKPEIPSGAALVAYTMLFHPKLIEQPDRLINATEFVGGEANHNYSLLFDETMASMAMAVGVHLGLINVKYSEIMNRLVVSANLETPIVKRTYELVKENHLGITHAKQLLIDLLTMEEFAGTLPLADDFIANHTFIEEVIHAVDMSMEEHIEQAKKAEMLQ